LRLSFSENVLTCSNAHANAPAGSLLIVSFLLNIANKAAIIRIKQYTDTESIC